MESCLEFALEGERLCNVGDYSTAVSYFEAAIRVGTEDHQILSAIYSQLGSAYFQLGNYTKALDFYRLDLTLTRTVGDQLGEAKASGNLGNTLKVLGQFEEAIFSCQKQLDICKAIHDKVGEARALYNLGNIYHAKGRSMCQSRTGPSSFPYEATAALQTAAEIYEANLLMVKKMGDREAQGRAYGNLGNTHYLLGNYGNAVMAHEQRLLIAKEFGDKAAERRAYCNLGNTCIFLGELEQAAQHYKRMLQLAQQLQDQSVEAQALYSLGNTYTLLQDYGRSIDYHLKHLDIARHLNDKVGEGHACWSLGNAYTALGNHSQALYFAEKHLEISKETGDIAGEQTARTNLSDLHAALGLSDKVNDTLLPKILEIGPDLQGASPTAARQHNMENMELVKLSPDNINNQNNDILTSQVKTSLAKASSKLSFISVLRAKMWRNSSSSVKVLQTTNKKRDVKEDTEQSGQEAVLAVSGDVGVIDQLGRVQNDHMDDHRNIMQEGKRSLSAPCSPTCPLLTPITESQPVSVCSYHERLLDKVSSSQVRWPDKLHTSQGCHPSVFGHLTANDTNQHPSEDFFNALLKCQSFRLDDKRCAEPQMVVKGTTTPDEDLFDLITRAQAERMDEQLVAFWPVSGRSSSY